MAEHPNNEIFEIRLSRFFNVVEPRFLSITKILLIACPICIAFAFLLHNYYSGYPVLFVAILVTGIFAFKLLTFYFSQVSKMRKIQMRIKNCLVVLK